MKKNNTVGNLFGNAPTPIVFGHRGVAADYPENTLPAFEALLEQKVPGVELDIHLTSDNIPIIIHDKNTVRTTGESFIVSKTPLAKLKELNAAAVFNQKGSTNCKPPYNCPPPAQPIETPIPTLKELFELAGKKLFYDLEVKASSRKKECIDILFNMVKEYDLFDFVLISSFNPFLVRYARKKGFSKTAVIYSTEKDVPFIFKWGLGKHIAKCNLLKPRKYQAIKATKERKNRPVCTWTVDSEEEAVSLANAGIIGICSNRPKAIMKALGQC